MARLDDILRDALRTDVIPCFTPEDDNFVRVRVVGGARNHLGELESYNTREERLGFAAVETTARGGLDDSERTERVVGGQRQGEILIMLLEDLLELGDRVERIVDPLDASVKGGTPFEVVTIEAPRLNGQVVSYQVTIREQAD